MGSEGLWTTLDSGQALNALQPVLMLMLFYSYHTCLHGLTGFIWHSVTRIRGQCSVGIHAEKKNTL